MNLRTTAGDVQAAVERLGEVLGVTVQPLNDWHKEPDSLRLVRSHSGYKVVWVLEDGATRPFYDDCYVRGKELCNMIFFAIKCGVVNLTLEHTPQYTEWMLLPKHLHIKGQGKLQIFAICGWNDEHAAWEVKDITDERRLVRRAIHFDSFPTGTNAVWRVYQPKEKA